MNWMVRFFYLRKTVLDRAVLLVVVMFIGFYIVKTILSNCERHQITAMCQEAMFVLVKADQNICEPHFPVLKRWKK